MLAIAATLAGAEQLHRKRAALVREAARLATEIADLDEALAQIAAECARVATASPAEYFTQHRRPPGVSLQAFLRRARRMRANGDDRTWLEPGRLVCISGEAFINAPPPARATRAHASPVPFDLRAQAFAGGARRRSP